MENGIKVYIFAHKDTITVQKMLNDFMRGREITRKNLIDIKMSSCNDECVATLIVEE